MFVSYALLVGILTHYAVGAVYQCDLTAPCGCSSGSQNFGLVTSIRINGFHQCSGAILNNQLIVAAAQCIARRSPVTVTICAGPNRMTPTCQQLQSADQIITHPGYNYRKNENNIALIRLSAALDLSDPSITRICLPSVANDNPRPGETVFALNWGRSTGGNQPNEVQQTMLSILDKSSVRCRSRVRSDQLQFCATTAQGKCPCESGPIVKFTSSQRWELVGLTSRACASGIYTRISAYQSFIDPYMRTAPLTSPPASQFTCDCQCPKGAASHRAMTTTNDVYACLNACIILPSNVCTPSNVHACLGNACAWYPRNPSYVRPIESAQTPGCQCQCPRGNIQHQIYALAKSPQECLSLCIAADSNTCTYSNVYACLGSSCAWYNAPVADSGSQSNCRCQCPKGRDSSVAYPTSNTVQACRDACVTVPANGCTQSNVHACLGNSCTWYTG